MRRHRQRSRAIEQLQIRNNKFNVASGDVGVFEACAALAHVASSGNHKFVAQSFGQLKCLGGFGVDDQLHDAGMVSQVDEYQPTMVSAGIYPT